MRVEYVFGWRQNFCHFRIACGDYNDVNWSMSLALPKLVAVWLSFGKTRWIQDKREFVISIYNWAIHLILWGRTDQWNSTDPWWIRGLSFHIDDLILGGRQYIPTIIDTYGIIIPLPEKCYIGIVKIIDEVRTRKRWLPIHRTTARVEIPSGIPFPDTSQHDPDVDEDKLYAYGCSSTNPEEIIAKGVKLVLECRRTYGGTVNWQPPSSTKPDLVSPDPPLVQEQ